MPEPYGNDQGDEVDWFDRIYGLVGQGVETITGVIVQIAGPGPTEGTVVGTDGQVHVVVVDDEGEPNIFSTIPPYAWIAAGLAALWIFTR